MGAGRVGVTLAEALEERGHSLAIIDSNPEAFRRLKPDFSGRRVTGLGFDRDALVQAGIDEAYAFAAVSNGDNSNILAARVVRETFGVDNVVARIYDAGRAEMYTRLGIPTVATVRWTADQMLRRLLPAGEMTEFTDSSGKVALVEMMFHEAWIGTPYAHVEEVSGARVGFLTRWGQGELLRPGAVVQENDIVHVLCPPDRANLVQRTLAAPPAKEEA
ncbi:MAG: TrkA family potassium uptake protein [Salana multivorans]|uniref:potassium channel family protein n=1 Tax=Salana multivorans TaxID=120377 RepID=UPI00095ADF1D|nr:TrkA family potassium uptake protein [Salana multivorans]MBN8881344.1 TrkA family potassium uptake protein [Salana multivorans]OJX94535.1 MAG: potassium transporter TrkA [Micrococcales bacterium 73-15]